jgi:MFS family permease
MWVLGLVIMIDQIDQNIVRGVVPQLKEAFGVNDAQIGLLLSAFVVVNGLVTVPAGYLADRWNRTRTIGHTVVGWSAITMLTAAAGTFGVLLALRAALGFGQAVTEPSAASLLSDYYPAQQRGRAFAVQQVLTFVGIGVGIALGGAIGERFGWRWAFIVVGPPGFVIALLAYSLREPRRGHADRMQLGVADDDGPAEHVALFEGGVRRFFVDMIRGLRDDFHTIYAIPTLRYALAGVGALLFTVSGIGAWLAVFHERFSGMTQDEATRAVGALLIAGGIPGILLGGRIADRYASRIRGARVVIPAYCIGVGNTIFIVSYLPIPSGLSILLQLIAIFAVTMAIPALRAGLADAVPAHLRGAGFGAFNLVSIVFGAALAPFLVGVLADVWNLRVAFLIVSPPVYIGAYILYKARDHLDADALKIFEAVMRAMQQDEERRAERD